MQGRILIVEDDPAIRELLKAVLEAGSHEVFEVGDGLSAHPTARDVKPDVVLCDIGLPGIDGFAVLGLLKDDPDLRHVPVIMVTAWAEPDLVVKAMDRGALDYIRKPFDISELSARRTAARPAAGGGAHDRVLRRRRAGAGRAPRGRPCARRRRRGGGQGRGRQRGPPRRRS